MKRRLCGGLVLFGHLICFGCGGGGGGSGGSANAPAPAPVVQDIAPFDAIPGNQHTDFNAAQKLVTIRHQGYVDFVFENRSACSALATTSWAARDLSDSELDAFFEHTLICDFAENQNQDITVRATRNNGDLYSSTSTVRAGVASGSTRVVQDTVVLPSTQVVAAISAYLAQELVTDLNLPLALLPIPFELTRIQDSESDGEQKRGAQAPHESPATPEDPQRSFQGRERAGFNRVAAGEAAQVLGQGFGRGVTVGGFFTDALQDDGFEVSRNLRIEASRRASFLEQNQTYRFSMILSLERDLPRQGFVERGTE